MSRWSYRVWAGPAAGYFEALTIEGRSVTRLELDQPTLVLGSAQPDSAADHAAAARAGVAVAHRRSGGSAVLVDASALWVDVTIPRDDPLWDDDVGRAFHWLGQAWTAALAALGVDAEWHSGAMRKTAWSPQVCFAGLGPGEVTVGGRKVVGLSQRRTRAGALFQCMATLAWDPAPLLGLLALSEEDRARGAAELADVASGVGAARADDLLTAFLTALGAN